MDSVGVGGVRWCKDLDAVDPNLVGPEDDHLKGLAVKQGYAADGGSGDEV